MRNRKTKNPLLLHPEPFKRFHIVRDKDVSGVSGTGIVAVGVVFPDHTAVIKWLSEIHSLAIYNSIGEVEQVHGHDGSTKIVYID